MDFVKRNWLLILGAAILLAATIVLTIMYRGASAATAEAGTQFNDVIQTELGILEYDVGPTESNVRKAETNIGAAEEELNNLLAKVDETFPPLVIEDLNSFEVKNELIDAYKEMGLALSEGEVENAVASYGFREFDERIPNPDEREMVLIQLRVVQAMVAVVAESGLTSLDAIERPPDLPMLQHALFQYYSFQMGVSGEMESIRKLLNGLHTTDLCLIVRNIEFNIQAPPMTTFGVGAPMIETAAAAIPPGGAVPRYDEEYPVEPGGVAPAVAPPPTEAEDDDAAELAKDVCTEHRIVWREPAYIEATLYIDFVQFRKQQEEE